MNFRDALSLGRVSNLPTVWTNMLAATVLVGASAEFSISLLLLLSMSLFYIGGMYLNDFFDSAIDSIERPDRPIPSGRVSRGTVFSFGFFMLVVGLALLMYIGFSEKARNGIYPMLGGIGLGFFIVLYNVWHKNNPISPIIMGLCRVFVYITTALCFVLVFPVKFWLGALMLFSYLIGLTYIAKQENLKFVKNMWPLFFLFFPVLCGLWLALRDYQVWFYLLVFVLWTGTSLRYLFRRNPGDIPKAVVSLIAGMCLLDAVLVASAGHVFLAVLAVGGFLLTLFLQRFVEGT